jgi:hypothetical protein
MSMSKRINLTASYRCLWRLKYRAFLRHVAIEVQRRSKGLQERAKQVGEKADCVRGGEMWFKPSVKEVTVPPGSATNRLSFNFGHGHQLRVSWNSFSSVYLIWFDIGVYHHCGDVMLHVSVCVHVFDIGVYHYCSGVMLRVSFCVYWRAINSKTQNQF